MLPFIEFPFIEFMELPPIDGFSSSATILWSIDGVETTALTDVGLFVETFVAIGVVGGSEASSLLMISFGS